MNVAKKVRLGKILDPASRKAVIVPIDHGLTVGPLPGIETMRSTERSIAHPAVNAVIAHKGVLERLGERGALAGKGVILHVNGMSVLDGAPDDKEPLTAVEAALRLGADAVSLQVNFTGGNERANFRQLGSVADDAARLGLPLLVMLYDKAQPSEAGARLRRTKQLYRAALELGTDLLKVSPAGEPAEIAEAIASVAEDLPVFVAGGEITDDKRLLALMSHALSAGAAGACIGRNVFARPDPAPILESLAKIIHGGTLRSPALAAVAGASHVV
jgi:class I fructose-bisphosphate aldolase